MRESPHQLVGLQTMKINSKTKLQLVGWFILIGVLKKHSGFSRSCPLYIIEPQAEEMRSPYVIGEIYNVKIFLGIRVS
ncbi:hypothetical protein F0562_001665 [Nyssa sinensis]|uniref:Uncharacterized protein n=1 Tax=Nyssa sinensis TaxID=561372 RepID=A0A5J5C3X5_9ASTE|nr:hypothetical protein F0562_001665 [Nyssa sinensis]